MTPTHTEESSPELVERTCPLCGSVMEPYTTHRTSEDFFKHPRNACVLSESRITAEDVASWPASISSTPATTDEATKALEKIEAAGLGGYLTPQLCAEITSNALAKIRSVPSLSADEEAELVERINANPNLRPAATDEVERLIVALQADEALIVDYADIFQRADDIALNVAGSDLREAAVNIAKAYAALSPAKGEQS